MSRTRLANGIVLALIVGLVALTATWLTCDLLVRDWFFAGTPLTPAQARVRDLGDLCQGLALPAVVLALIAEPLLNLLGLRPSRLGGEPGEDEARSA